MGNCLSRSRTRGDTDTDAPSCSSCTSRDIGPDSLVHGEFVYLKEEKLGWGGFGVVYTATQLPTHRKVALKFTSEENGRREEKFHRLFSSVDCENRSIELLLDSFVHKSLYCLVFQKLDVDLFKYTMFNRFHVTEIRAVLQQLLVALQTLKSFGVVHADIKLDNIMLVDRRTQALKVVLIDFGVAKRREQMRSHLNLLVIAYKAPELLLGLPGDEGVDMWALGCVAAHLFIGVRSPFPEHCPYQCLRAVVQMLGQPPDDVLEAAPNTPRFFDLKNTSRDDTTSHTRYRLLTPKEYVDKNGLRTYPRLNFATKYNSLYDLPTTHPKPRNKLEKEDMSRFMFLLRRMLCVDSSRRLTPEQGLRHKFVTMRHLANRMDDPYVKASLRHMQVCQSISGDEFFAEARGHVLTDAKTQSGLRRAVSDLSLQLRRGNESLTKGCSSCGSTICARASHSDRVDEQCP